MLLSVDVMMGIKDERYMGSVDREISSLSKDGVSDNIILETRDLESIGSVKRRVGMKGCLDPRVWVRRLKCNVESYRQRRLALELGFFVDKQGTIIGRDGGYIGLCGVSRKSLLFYLEHAIYPELAKSSDYVCSIGFSAKDDKWYGWSHRAVCGFAIGDIIDKEHVMAYDDVEGAGATLAKFGKMPVGFKCKTFNDCKKCAIAFAKSVS